MEHKFERAILSYTDGFELTMREYNSFEAAQSVMFKEYNERINRTGFDADESYCIPTSAKCIITGEDVYIWEIRCIRGDISG